MWFDRRLSRLNWPDSNGVLAHGYSTYEVPVCLSTIKHPGAVMGFHFCQPLTKGESVRFYNQKLVFKDMSEFRNCKVYEEFRISITAPVFRRRSTAMLEKLCCSDDFSENAWMVPSEFCVMSIINDFRSVDVKSSVIGNSEGGGKLECHFPGQTCSTY